MLKEMIQQSSILNDKPAPDQAIILRLAQSFEADTNALFMNPEELVEYLNIGTKDSWQEFLNLQPVKSYIQGQMGFIGQIAQRKTFHSLVTMALSGNQQAAKQVQELSGIMNQQDSNRTIILHHVPRPNTNQEVI